MKDNKFAFFLTSIYFIFTFIFFICYDNIILLSVSDEKYVKIFLKNEKWLYLIIVTPIIFIFTLYILKNYREKLENLENLLNKTPIGIILFNEDGKVLLVNSTFTKLTGYSIEDINTIEKIAVKIFGENSDLIKKALNPFVL